MRLLHAMQPPIGGIDIELLFGISESNGSGTGDNLNQLPAGALSATPLANTLIFDSRNINGAGAGWTHLIPGPMEQQPGNAYGAGAAGATDNTSSVFTNTVGWIGRAEQFIRVRQPTTVLGFVQCVEGGGRLTDSSTRGRKANYDPQYNDGAYNVFKTQALAAIAALPGLGYRISKRKLLFDFGGNDAIHGDTSNAAWLTPARAVIAQIIADGIISSTDQIIFGTLGKLLTGAGGIPDASRIAQNANIAALVADDPTHRSMIPSDGQTPMTYYYDGSAFGTDPIHLSAGGHWNKGEFIGWEYLKEWYPFWENMNGGAAVVTHEHNFGDYRNLVTSQTLTSGSLQTVFDWQNLSTPTQATPANQPALGATTLANGLVSRHATGNGSTTVLVTTVPTEYNRSPTVMSGVLKAPSEVNKVPFCEAGGAVNTPLCSPFYNNAGVATIILKNNAGTVVGPTSLGQTLYDNNWNQFLFVDDSAQARLDLNGNAGTPVTSTRGVLTVTTQSYFAQRYNNNTQTINLSVASWRIRHGWSAEPNAAVKAKLVTFYRDWHGSN
jgi:hypothetical protein